MRGLAVGALWQGKRVQGAWGSAPPPSPHFLCSNQMDWAAWWLHRLLSQAYFLLPKLKLGLIFGIDLILGKT